MPVRTNNWMFVHLKYHSKRTTCLKPKDKPRGSFPTFEAVTWSLNKDLRQPDGIIRGNMTQYSINARSCTHMYQQGQ